MFSEHGNVSNNGISSPPAGIGDVWYFVDITVPLTEPPSDFIKNKHASKFLSGCGQLFSIL